MVINSKNLNFNTLIFIGVSIIFFLLNRAVPFYADDYGWVNTLPNESVWASIVSRFKSFDFLPTTCGRLTCHLAVQLLIPFGELWFDCINAIMLLSSMLLTQKLCFSELKNSALVGFLIILAFLYFPPHAETLFYWGSGSANYLFPLLLTLIFLNGVCHYTKLNVLQYTLLCIVSFATGWAHEIFSLPIACTIIVYSILQRKHIHNRQFVLFGAFLLGSICLILSPGSLHRLLGQEESVLNVHSFLIHILQGFKMFRDGKWLYILIALFCWMLIRNRYIHSFIKANLFYFLCLLSSFCMIAILGHGGRAIWGIEIFSFFLVCRFLDNKLSPYKEKINKYALIACLCLLIHQAMLIEPFHDSWGTYRSAERAVHNTGSLCTVPIEDWFSNNPLIDNYVAHPYQMMMHDSWMRIPGCHSYCRKDIYEELQSMDLSDNQYAKFGDVWIAIKTKEIVAKIESGEMYYELLPISYESQQGFLSNSWHMLLQKIVPDRYPSRVRIMNGDIMELRIQDKEYILFNQPFCPIWRDIKTIIW